MIRHIDIEMTVIKKKVFIFRDPEKQEEYHVMQGHMGKHQGHSGGRRGREKDGQKPLV